MNKKSVIPQLFEFAGKYRFLTIASWILSALSAVIAFGVMISIWQAVQEVLTVMPDVSQAAGLPRYGWAAVGYSVLSLGVYVLALLCSHLAAFRIQTNMRIRLSDHLMKLSPNSYANLGSGRIRKIIMESSTNTETYLAHQLPDAYNAYATVFCILILMLVFDWRIGLLCLLPVIFAFAIMSRMTGRNMEAQMNKYQAALNAMSNEAVEYIRGIAVVKTFGQSLDSFERFKETIDNYETWVIAYTKSQRKPMVIYTTLVNGIFAMIVLAGIWFSQGSVTVSLISNLMFYIMVTPLLTLTLTRIMFMSENLMIVSNSLQNFESILSIPPLPVSEEPSKPANSSVRFENVTYSYSDDKAPAFKNISLDIPEGSHVALVGPSGSGKSTLAALASRQFDPDQGSVYIGNLNLRSMDEKTLNENVSFVFQNSRLIKGTIAENVRMGNPQATDAQVRQALHDAQCDDILEKFPDGMNTVIGSRGTYVSGGEVQRIAIARAYLKDAPILILDEATAFADPDNEVKVQEAFEKLARGRTVIMIAHRLSAVRNADRIFVLENGEIRESGSHEVLKNQNGLYAHLWHEFNRSVNWKVGE